MTKWDRALYSGQLLPPRQQHQLESLVSETTGNPSPAPPSPTRPATGSASRSRPPGRPERPGITRARPFGYRVVHYYFPRSGMIIALAVNSATGNDDIADLAGSVYQTLQNAGAVHTG